MAKKRFYKKSQQQMQKLDSEMISEDRSAVANLPQGVIQKDWPRTTYYNHRDLGAEDNVRGIDRQMDEDTNGASKHRSKRKY